MLFKYIVIYILYCDIAKTYCDISCYSYCPPLGEPLYMPLLLAASLLRPTASHSHVLSHLSSLSLQITPSPLRTLTTDHTVIIIVQYTGHWFWFTAALNSSQPFPNLTWCTHPACRATITQRSVAAVHSHFHYRRRILLCWLTKRLITLPSTRFVFYLTWVATTTTGLHESEQSQGVIRHRYSQCCSITEHTA